MSTPLTSHSTHRVLVVGSLDESGGDILSSLTPHADFAYARTIEEALELAQDGDFDLIVDASGELLPSAQTASSAAGRILRDIAHPVFIIDRNGQMSWCNPRTKAYPKHVVEALRGFGAAHLESLRKGANGGRTRREQIDVDREYYFDLVVSPLLGDGGEVERAVALAVDNSGAARLQDKIDAIDLAGRELVGIDVDLLASMGVGDRLEFLEEKIINCCRDLLHFDHFALLLVEPKSHRLETLVASGLVEADGLNMSVGEDNNGICGLVASTGVSYICPDVTKDGRYLPGLDKARSSLTVPLALHHHIVGVLNVESDKLAAFTQEDRQFAEIFGRYIAIALHTLRLLAAERQTATGQIVADVDAESAHPLNDIVTDVAKLMEDYGGDAALRERLKAILEDVDRVRDAIHAVTDAGPVSGSVDADKAGAILRGKRILVADDEDVIRDTITDVLVKHGAIVSMARDGQEAVVLLHAQTFDLVLTDIKMPHRNGYEVFAEARKLSAGCPVVLITGFGYDPEHSIVRASKQGLAGVLFKPFKVSQLLDEIRHAFEGAAASQ